MNKIKTGLIVEGGGMKCAYGAAILDSFLDDAIQFDYVIGVSAGSANALSFLAGQRGRNLRFYTTHLGEPGYFGFRSFLKTGDLFGLDYIYSTMTDHNGSDPLDFERIMENPAEYELVTTNAFTGEPEYHSKEEMGPDNYEWVKASCALPAACRPRIINGTPYYDGGVSDAIPCDRALEKGCGRIVVILSKPRNFVKEPEKMRLFYTAACRKYPKIIDMLNNRPAIYQKKYDRTFELEREKKAFVFAESEHLKMSTFAMDPAENQRLYDLGMKDYRDGREKLLQFLGREDA